MNNVIVYFSKKSRLFIIALGLAFVLLWGIFDYLTGPLISFSIFYLIPISIVTWFANREAGILTSIISAIVWLIADLLWEANYPNFAIPFWNAAVRLGFFLIVVFSISALRELKEHLEKKVAERTATLEAEITERKRAEGEIRKLNEELEKRVIERTAKILATNRELKKEVSTRKRMQEALRKAHDELEIKVGERTADLIKANEALQAEIVEHQRAEEELKSSHERLRALAARLESIREEERKKISREIHDHLGQVLTGLKIDLCSLEEDLSQVYNNTQQNLIDQVRAMSNLTDVLVEEVRKIARELRPAMLDSLGLISAIEWQVQDFQKRTGIQCEFTSDKEPMSLNQVLSTAVFRIFQETLTNIARHASATRIHINLVKNNSDLILEVEDNGRGITEEEISNPKSLGLIGMRERALLFEGEFNITGHPKKGTRVNICIPLMRAGYDQNSHSG